MPLLVTTTEIGTILGITREQVEQIISTDDSFPVPEATVLASVRIWSFDAVESWHREQMAAKSIPGTLITEPRESTTFDHDRPPSPWTRVLGRIPTPRWRRS